MKKKVLIITYYWPPSGGSGVQRWVYFSKYLKKLGYEPIVLTVDPEKATYPYLDESLVNEVENIRVITSDSFEPLQLYSKIVSGNKQKGVPYGHVPSKNTSLFKKGAAFLRGNIILPDARKYWKKYALKEAREIIQKEKIDLLITTGPPHSSHLIGLTLKKETQLPWLVDFRDPWTEVFYNKDLYRTKWAAKYDQKLEKKVLDHADRVLCVSDYLTMSLQQKVSTPSKIQTLINGFDHELFERIKAVKKDSFTVTYVGYLGQHHPYKIFLESLEKVAENHKDQSIKLDLAGNIEAGILEEIKQIKNTEVSFDGFVSHDKAIEKIKSADLLFISIPTSSYSKGIITGKLLEYLATGNPIVLLAEKDSDAAKILSAYNHTFVTLDNQEELIAFIEKVFSKEIVPNTNNETVEQYSRMATTKKLATLIDQLC